MKIVVLSGSPRKGANTDTMVEAFAETAREGDNAVEVVRVASKKIAGCLGCLAQAGRGARARSQARLRARRAHGNRCWWKCLLPLPRGLLIAMH